MKSAVGLLGLMLFTQGLAPNHGWCFSRTYKLTPQQIEQFQKEHQSDEGEVVSGFYNKAYLLSGQRDNNSIRLIENWRTVRATIGRIESGEGASDLFGETEDMLPFFKYYMEFFNNNVRVKEFVESKIELGVQNGRIKPEDRDKITADYLEDARKTGQVVAHWERVLIAAVSN